MADELWLVDKDGNQCEKIADIDSTQATPTKIGVMRDLFRVLSTSFKRERGYALGLAVVLRNGTKMIWEHRGPSAITPDGMAALRATAKALF